MREGKERKGEKRGKRGKSTCKSHKKITAYQKPEEDRKKKWYGVIKCQIWFVVGEVWVDVYVSMRWYGMTEMGSGSLYGPASVTLSSSSSALRPSVVSLGIPESISFSKYAGMNLSQRKKR